MRKKVDFLIRYEHKVRELESIMLIKIELERRGYSVDLIGNYEYDRKDYPKPRVFVSPAIYSDGQLKWDLFRYGMMPKIANLLWEQLIGIEEEEDIHGFHNVSGIGTRVISFCWGKKSHDRIVRGGVPNENAPVVGQISTDLLRWGFRDVLMNKVQLSEKYHVEYDKKWYLFISSFAFCEMDPLQEKIAIEAWGKDNVDSFKTTSNNSRAAILDWFERHLIGNTDTIIIYRPHPDETEKCSRLKEMSAKYPNFRVISQEALKQWVNACDKVYNWYSTGMVDAIVLQKPLRLLRPYPINRELDYRIMISAKSITSQEDFDCDFEDISRKDVIDKQLFESYYFLPNRPVYLQICDVLEEMLQTSKYDLSYTIKEHLNHFKELIKWNVFWFLEKHLISKIPSYLLPSFYKNALANRKVRISSVNDGFKKNVASDEDLDDIYKRLRPIILKNAEIPTC